VREWLLELRMMGRRPRTIEWYRQKMAWYLKTSQAETLGQLTAYELKRYLGELRDRAWGAHLRCNPNLRTPVRVCLI